MKPASLPLAAQDTKAADAVYLERQRVLARAMDEMYFWVEIEPGVGALRGTSTVDATTFNFTFEDFPAAGITARRRTRRLLGLWPRTAARFHLWYTSPVASTNLFTLAFTVRQLDAGMLLSGPAANINQGFTAAGPGTINSVLYATFVATGTFASTLRVCNFTFSRQGPDANANDFRFIFGAFELMEAA